MDSPSSSVESSPNAPRRSYLCMSSRSCHHRSKSYPYCQIQSVILTMNLSPPTSYYTSPSRPEKRRHLTIPSPKMAQLSIRGPARQLTSSIPGYGQGTKKTLRLTAARLNRMESTATAASQHTFSSVRTQGARPISDPAFLNSPLLTVRMLSLIHI